MHKTVYGVYFPLIHKPRNASKVLPEINETKYPCDDKCSLIAGIVNPYNGRNTSKGRNS